MCQQGVVQDLSRTCCRSTLSLFLRLCLILNLSLRLVSSFLLSLFFNAKDSNGTKRVLFVPFESFALKKQPDCGLPQQLKVPRGTLSVWSGKILSCVPMPFPALAIPRKKLADNDLYANPYAPNSQLT